MTRTAAAAASLAAALAVSSILLAPLGAASPVNMSRLVVSRTITGGGPGFYDLVSGDRIQELCADEDGCVIAIRMESSDGYLQGGRGQLFYGRVQPKWHTTVTSGTDGQNGAEFVVGISSGDGNFCDVSDAEPGTDDDGVGFSLQTLNDASPVLTCEFVIAD